MGMITGGVLRTPRGLLSWRPAAPVAKEFEFLTKSPKDKYLCLGVGGNWSHLSASFPGDHTPYSTHDITVHGVHYVPKKGWVYAFDSRVPEPGKFEKWFLGRLRAGYYPFVKYWNISGRHWNRAVTAAGKPFARSSFSGDDHLHVSMMPGSEYLAAACFLADYERWRTTGKNTAVKAPTVVLGRSAPKPVVLLMDAAAAKLPAQSQGTHGPATKLIQAFLIAWEMWPRTDRSARARITGVYDAGTTAAVKSFQRKVKLPASGVVDSRTWRALAPDAPSTVIRGTDGSSAWTMQCLLLARGFNPGVLDGDAGDNTIAALKRFQVASKVRNSVVAGRGDGIGGPGTWAALITL